MSTEIKKTKGFFHQILVEIKILFSSKFNIILAALIILGAIAVPIVGKVQSNRVPVRYYGNSDMEDLNVDGQIISAENPLFWEIRDMLQMIEHYEQNASTETDDLTIEFFNLLLDGSLLMATQVDSYEDYRSDLTWQRMQLVTEKFILEHLDVPQEDLIMVVQYRMYFEPAEFKKKYYDLSQLEVLQKLEEIDARIEQLDKIVLENDHREYYRFQMKQVQDSIQENLDRIEALEKDIVENPQNEDMYNEQIVNLQRSISSLQEIDIPDYEYRIANDIVPRSGDWRDTALETKRNAQYFVIHNVLLTEEEFEQEDYLKREFKTYNAYKKNWQDEMDAQTQKQFVAEQSLASGKPDMDYVADGARKKKVGFLWYSLIIAMLASVIGGGLMAKEYQSGTIRLLLIRPKTRVKIVLSKFIALIAVCLALYIAADVVNFVANGVVFGFSDYSFPNYTISSGAGGIGFMAYYLPKLLICFISVLFAGSLAYFFSMVTRSTAISVAIPLISFVGSLIVMQMVMYRNNMQWLAYTPIPYFNLSMFFTTDMTYMGFKPIMGLGIVMLLGLSALLVALGVFISDKRDITN